MTTPAHGGDAHATGAGTRTSTSTSTGTVSVAPASAAPASAAPGGVVTLRGPGRNDGRSGARPDAVARLVPVARPEAVARPVPVAHSVPAVRLAQGIRPDAVSEAAPRQELSSTSAVGLVLAGGAVLVIAGQLLRLRLRLRRERRGDADES
ncbi:hypothetical protein [Streptomyces sp. NPDC054765]